MERVPARCGAAGVHIKIRGPRGIKINCCAASQEAPVTKQIDTEIKRSVRRFRNKINGQFFDGTAIRTDRVARHLIKSTLIHIYFAVCAVSYAKMESRKKTY